MTSVLLRSGLPPERLDELLRSLRAICAGPDHQAIPALDRLLVGLRLDFEYEELPDDLRWQRTRALEDIDRLRDAIQRVRAGLIEPGPRVLPDAQGLRQLAQHSGGYLDPRLDASFRAELDLLRTEANDLADQAEVTGLVQALREATTQVIHSASSVRTIIAMVDGTVVELKKREHWNDRLVALHRTAKERAARFRAQRRLDDADVAAAGGNARKVERLRREAAVMLAQDWALAFPGEPAPPID